MDHVRIVKLEERSSVKRPLGKRIKPKHKHESSFKGKSVSGGYTALTQEA